MQLFHTPASPFTRKVMIAAIELGLDDRIEIRPTRWPLTWATQTVPFTAGLVDANPIGRIPTLITDDGVALPDSTLICEYLDTQHDGPRLIPQESPLRWEVMNLHAIADGMLEAEILIRAERLRPEHERSAGAIAKQEERIVRCLDAIEAHPRLDGPVNLGQVAVGAACGYVDFRDWLADFRPGRPRLAAWYAAFAGRPSMTRTVPGETPE